MLVAFQHRLEKDFAGHGLEAVGSRQIRVFHMQLG